MTGVYDPEYWKPGGLGLAEKVVENILWPEQPKYGWDNRPHYADGTPMNEGDMIVLEAKPLHHYNPTPMISYYDETNAPPTYVNTTLYNGTHYATLEREPDMSHATHYQVHNDHGNFTLVDQGTGLPLSWNQHWTSSDPYFSGNPAASSVGFDSQGNMYFQEGGKPLWASDTEGSLYLNHKDQGVPVHFRPVRV